MVAVVGLLVVFVIGFVVWSLVHKDTPAAESVAPDTSASPCVTATKPTSEVLPLPSQVRVLPRSEQSAIWWWIGAAAIAIVSLVAWQLAGPRWLTSPRPVAEAGESDQPAGRYLEGPASRLALDLMVAPDSGVPAGRTGFKVGCGSM